jgi:hypothetical protein
MEVGRVRPPFFTGRQEALDKIHSVFWLPPTPGSAESQPRHSDRKKITISGLSGSGKTAVALEYAYAHREQYYAIFWLNARTPKELAISASNALRRIIEEYQKRWGDMFLRPPDLCQRLASALHMFDGPVTDLDGLVMEAVKGEHSVERFMAWLPSGLPWLLILDGYGDPEGPDIDGDGDPEALEIDNDGKPGALLMGGDGDIETETLDIDRLLPKTAVGHVLITSRNPDPCRTDEQIALAPNLGQADGVKLLTKATGTQKTSCCPGKSELGCKHAQQIVESVGGLPILINIVGSYLRGMQGKVTFEDYVRPPKSVAESVGEVKESYYSRTFQKTFNELGTPEKELMQLCSLMKNIDIPTALFKGGIGVVDWMTGMIGSCRRDPPAVA